MPHATCEHGEPSQALAALQGVAGSRDAPSLPMAGDKLAGVARLAGLPVHCVSCWAGSFHQACQSSVFPSCGPAGHRGPYWPPSLPLALVSSILG